MKKLEGKKKDTEEDLGNVSTGKKSVRTIFKSDKDATGMQS
jgi:hypothetical protein